MIPTFIINLDSATQRLNTISERLETLQVPWERVPAVNGKTISSSTHKEENKRARDRKLSYMELGCLHSHVSIWKRIIDEHIDVALILEDDVLIADSLPSLLNDLSWLPNDNCIVRLETFLRPAVLGPKTMDVAGSAIYPLRSIQHGGAAYIMTHKQAETLIRCYHTYIDTSDHMLFRYPREHNVYQIVPAVCIQQDIFYNGRLGATSALEEQRYLFQLRSLYQPATLVRHFIWRICSTATIILDRLKGYPWKMIPFKG
jgi:glycosyl transferase, family 25